MAVALTGRFNFRRTIGGKIVLQVEEDKPAWWARKGKTRRRYRDATVMDLAKPERRALIDLRNRPQFLPSTSRPAAEGLGPARVGAAEGAAAPMIASVDPQPERRISTH